MQLSIIVAVSRNHVIGKNNDLVWNLPDDMTYFKEKTRGHHVIMGRKNFFSIPAKWRPLPDRPNIVVTRQSDLEIPNVRIVHSIDEGITLAEKAGESEAFIIGGGEIFRQSLDVVAKIYFTDVKGEFDGDTFFPELLPSKWKEVKRIPHPKDEKHDYAFDFVEYIRK